MQTPPGRGASAAGRWHRIAPLVLLVAGLHAILLSVPVRSSHGPEAAGPGPALQVRVLAAASKFTSPTPTPSTAAPVDETPAPHSTPMPARDAPTLEPLARPPEVTLDLEPGAVSPPQALVALVLPGIDADEDYFPRSLLSQGPRPVEPVLIDYPAIDDDKGSYRSELTLFIDERGQVARVRVEGDELPAPLEAAARSAFLGTRFHAGEVEGRAVKSRIRVEVVFDNRPIGASS